MSFDDIGLNLDKTHIFGILNVTPDSFSDGGNFFNTDQAVKQAHKLRKEGATVIDVGGESTRPGAERISSQEELSRVIPVIKALSEENFLISVDTMRAEVASAAIEAGAKIINDVSGGKADSNMLKTISELNVACILMHWRAQSKNMDELAVYQNVVTDVCSELNTQVDLALAAGIKKENIAIDPGLGFAKKSEHNWSILKNIHNIKNLGFPVLVGHSRKRFLNELDIDSQDDLAVKDLATAVVSYQLALDEIWAIRVHQAKPNAIAIAAANKIKKQI